MTMYRSSGLPFCCWLYTHNIFITRALWAILGMLPSLAHLVNKAGTRNYTMSPQTDLGLRLRLIIRKNATLTCFAILLYEGMCQIMTSAMLFGHATPGWLDFTVVIPSLKNSCCCQSLYLAPISENTFKKIMWSFYFPSYSCEIRG